MRISTTPPPNNHSSTNHIWEKWKQSLHTIINDLTCSRTKQRKHNKMRSHFLINRFALLKSVQ